MGDRGNIAVRFTEYGTDNQSTIYFYTHHRGYKLPEVLASALDSPEGRNRLTADAYLARIIFDHLTEGSHGQETGYGISTSIQGNEHPVLYADTAKHTVRVGDDDDACTYSYQEFIDAVVSPNTPPLKGWE